MVAVDLQMILRGIDVDMRRHGDLKTGGIEGRAGYNQLGLMSYLQGLEMSGKEL